ncbi:right-handed parallel beta-helix repeat-containing protein, partial [Methanobrevibacter sp.]
SNTNVEDVSSKTDNKDNIEDTNPISSNKDSNVVSDGETAKSFTELNSIINNGSITEITLDSNFTFNNATDNSFIDGITISRSNIVIDGNYNTIDGNGQARIFKITGENVIIKNLYFKNGHSNEGGAIRIEGGSKCSIINSTFTKNHADNSGGAIYMHISSSNHNIINCIFTENNASMGGAILMSSPKSTIINSTFTKNSGKHGSSINIQSDKITVSNSTFTENNASMDGGAIYTVGSNSTIINSTFTQNNASRNGGAIYLYGPISNVINSTFTQNNANNNSGALYIAGANSTVINSTFTQNNANNNSGALYLAGANGTVINSTFTQNNASKNGGAMFVQGNNVIINNVTILNNTAEYGAGIYNKGKDLNISHSTFTGNKVNNIILWPGATITVDEYTKEHTKGVLISKFTNTNARTFNITYGEEGIISATIYTNDTFVDIGNVSVVINGRNYTANVDNGIAIIVLNDLSAREYTDVIVKYNGNDEYMSSSTIVNFTVKPKSANITAPAASFIINYDSTYNVTVNPKLTGVIIRFVLNGVNIGSATTDANGIASITLTTTQLKNIGTGTKILNVTFAGNENYTSSEAITTINIIKENTNITAPPTKFIINHDGTYNVTVNPKFANAIILFVLDGVNIGFATTDAKGIAQVTITATQLKKIGAGIKALEATFIGNDYYTSSAANTTIEITKEATNITAPTANFIINYGGNYKVTVNTKVSGANVSFVLNGENIGSAISNAKGDAIITLTAAQLKKAGVGVKVLKATFAGNNYYTGSTASAKITINKEASKFANVKSVKKSYKANAKSMQLTATLKDSKNKVIESKVVIFKIRNKTYKVKTNSKGVAILTLNRAKIKTCKINKKGTYKFTVTFNEDTYYNKATAKGTLKVVK